ncbi:PLP-dependent transferase, partial [Ramicandelaber brevisporus]
QPPVEFGRSLRKHYVQHAKYVNLNNGSFGTSPRAIYDVTATIRESVELAIDQHMFITLRPAYDEALRVASEFLGANEGFKQKSVTFVPNSTHGSNAVLRSFGWKEGDRLLSVNTTYGAVLNNISYVTHVNPVEEIQVKLEFPLTNAQVLQKIVAKVDELEAAATDGRGHRVHLAVMDLTFSVPGTLLPLRRLIEELHERGIRVLVDGAHGAGQIPIDIEGDLRPDYFVTNFHKWASVPRGCAFLYVNPDIQTEVKPPVISYGYGTNNITDEFHWQGTFDHAPYLTVPAALAWRRVVAGGEERIHDYCHKLAIEGAKRVADILGTEVLVEKLGTAEEQVGTMIDVYLPNSIDGKELGDETYATMRETLLEKWNVATAPHKHEGQWFVRLSAQIFNDVRDFEYGGHAI